MYLPPATARRAVAPLMVIILLTALVLFATLAALSSLAWPLTRRRRAVRLGCFAVTYLVVELAVLTACAWHWVRRPGGRRSGPEWVAAHTALLSWALTVLLRAARAWLHFRVDLVEPTDTTPLHDHQPILVLARHGGPGDSLALVQLLLTRYGRSVRIVLKEMLAVDPALDVLLTRLNCVFLPAAGRRSSASDLLARAAADLGDTDAMLLFPEGNNWTPARRARVIDHMRRRGRKTKEAEQLEYLLPPRTSGALTCLKARPDLDVVLFAHTGLEELVTIKDVWDHLPFETAMSVHWWKSTSRPRCPDFEAVDDWLLSEWAAIDQWIGTQADQGRRLRREAGT